MKIFRFQLIISLGALILITFSACRHQLPFPEQPVDGNNGNNGGGGNSNSSTCSTDTVYFVNEIMPIISSNCTMSGCHDATSHADGVNLTNYQHIVKYVKAGNAGDSELYDVIMKTDDDRMPPAPMPPLSQLQKDKIGKWISQGAINNSCSAKCDTTVFTYSGAVKSIMDNKCVGCHNPSSLGGNIDLSTHSAVEIVALNGKLFGSVAHLGGYSPMPKNSAKLSDCEIKQIQKWINDGSLNN